MEIIILAGGLGKRMGQDKPKVLTSLKNKPLISYVVKAVEKSLLCPTPTIVIGHKGELIKEYLGDGGFKYAKQEEQLGTAHAVLSAEDAVDNENDVLILYGDQPNISDETIKKIVNHHKDTKTDLTMAVLEVPDFNEWRAGFYDFGRIVRDENGNLNRIVEKKDSTEKELSIRELNPSYFCINGNWLWPTLKKINKKNAQGEYYLTDIIEIAVKENKKIETVKIEPEEALGVNTREQLNLLEKIL